MKVKTADWVAKAEADSASLEREARTRKKPNHDLVCFLAQQCAEKYLKARLHKARIPFPKTHDLQHLMRLALPIEPLWSAFQPDFAFLTEFAVLFRYPGRSADRAMALQARRRCRAFRHAARAALGLKP